MLGLMLFLELNGMKNINITITELQAKIKLISKQNKNTFSVSICLGRLYIEYLTLIKDRVSFAVNQCFFYFIPIALQIIALEYYILSRWQTKKIKLKWNLTKLRENPQRYFATITNRAKVSKGIKLM